MKRLLLSALFVLFVFRLWGQSEPSGLEIEPYGFIRLNTTLDFQDLNNSDLFRPAQINLGEEANHYPHLFMSAKQSRFGLKVKKELKGNPLQVKVEMDFHNNSDQPGGLVRLRHAYFTFQNWTLGQTWSNFYDISSRPKIVDFEGPNSAALYRVPQVKFIYPLKNQELSFSIENPIEQLTITEGLQVQKQLLPDVLTSWKMYWDDKQSFVKVATITRQLRYERPNDDHAKDLRPANLWAGGAMASAKIKTTKADQLKMQVVAGKGLARYIRGVRNLGYDAICKPGCYELESIGIYGGFVAYEHEWAPSWTSTFLLGAIDILQVNQFEAEDLDYSIYGSVNVFYEPNASLCFGLEYLYGEKHEVSGRSGHANRIQMAATMKF